MNNTSINEFETLLSDFFGSKYAVAIDSCTHGIELCFRYLDVVEYNCPIRTYISIPMLSNKLNISRTWNYEIWENYYYLTHNIIDAAVLWKPKSYIKDTYMCISFQFQKHLSLGRGGMILLDDPIAYNSLKKMSYDGRIPNIPWRDQNIDTLGYHYYMTPETAQLGIDKFHTIKNEPPRKWKYTDWPDLSKMKVFN